MCTEYCCWQLRENGESQKISGQLWTVCFCLKDDCLRRRELDAWHSICRPKIFLVRNGQQLGEGVEGRDSSDSWLCHSSAGQQGGSYTAGQSTLRQIISADIWCTARVPLRSSAESPQCLRRGDGGRAAPALGEKLLRWSPYQGGTVVSSSSLSQVSHSLDCTKCI